MDDDIPRQQAVAALGSRTPPDASRTMIGLVELSPMTPISDSEVAVWYWFTENLDALTLSGLADLLSPEELVRAARFHFERNRRDFVAAHALLRRVVAACVSTSPNLCVFETRADGKPVIAGSQAGDPPLCFNLSHTDGLVACVVARDVEVGIDVERIERGTGGREVAGRYFAPPELDVLDGCAEAVYATRFIELWTLKEAYLKGRGTGLGTPLDSFAFTFPDSAALRFTGEPGADAARWRFLLVEPGHNCRLAVAVEDREPARQWRITLHDADPEENRPAQSLRHSLR